MLSHSDRLKHQLCTFIFQLPFLEINANGDMNSIGSNAASDVSWEQIDETDAKLVRWVPDHAVTHCADCGQVFNLVVRKHHCR